MPPNKAQPPPEKDPLAFAAKVSAWLDDVSEKITEFKEELGQPALAIDADLLSDLRQMARIVDGTRGDLRAQLPAE